MRSKMGLVTLIVVITSSTVVAQKRSRGHDGEDQKQESTTQASEPSLQETTDWLEQKLTRGAGQYKAHSREIGTYSSSVAGTPVGAIKFAGCTFTWREPTGT